MAITPNVEEELLGRDTTGFVAGWGIVISWPQAAQGPV
jgi:hypothetical protein